MDFLDSVGALRAPRGRLPRTGARAPGPRRTRRGLRISRPRPATPPRPRLLGGAGSATAAAPASLSRVSDGISRSAAGTQQTTSADQCPRPVGTTDATRPPHLTPSASPTPPLPRLLGGAGIRDRGGARVPFPRLGRHQSSSATAYALPAAPQPPRAGALTPRARRSSVAGRARFGHSAVAAANAPGSQCFRSHTTTGVNAAIYDRRAPPRGRIAQTQQTCSAPPAAAAAPFRPRIGGDLGPIDPSTILRARALPCRARRAAGPIGAVCCLGLRSESCSKQNHAAARLRLYFESHGL